VEATLGLARAARTGKISRQISRRIGFGKRVPFQMSVAERLLIARLKERDERAFNEIVRAHGDKVFSLVYRMIGNRAEAEDLAQEVFVTVFKTVDTFRGESKFSTWLLRIAANHAKNRIKHLARRPTEGVDPDDVSQVKVSNDRPGPPVQSRIEGPDKLLEAMEIERLMQEEIAKLPEDQRLLVALRDVEDLSYDDMSVATGAGVCPSG